LAAKLLSGTPLARVRELSAGGKRRTEVTEGTLGGSGLVERRELVLVVVVVLGLPGGKAIDDDAEDDGGKMLAPPRPRGRPPSAGGEAIEDDNENE
jgi:hypothetical protein